MPDLVVFRLVAPLAAFGDIAGDSRRGTWPRPSHSMVAGLVAGAFGLPRSQPGHEAIAAGFHLAIRTDQPGLPLSDYHTAQAPPRRKGRAYATRRAELAVRDDLGTMVSQRDYLSGAAFTLLLWPEAGAPHQPSAIAAALNRPVFAPFAGRRACPLGAPMAARVVAAETLAEAFAAYDELTLGHRRLLEQRLGWGMQAGDVQAGGEIVFDQALEAVRGDGLAVHRQETRRDRLASRSRWQFAPRLECVARLAAATGEA